MEEQDFLLDITTEDETYIIKAFGNENRPDDKQMKVVVKPFSGKDLGLISHRTAQDVKKELTKRGKDFSKELFIEIYEETVPKWEFVHKIKELINFNFKIGDEIKTFDDPEELYSYENPVIATIVQELKLHFDGLDRLDEKN